MEPVRLIRDSRELNGSAYYELLPGPYAGRHWGERSVFLSEDAFNFIGWVIQRHSPDFNPFGPTRIAAATWQGIIADLNRFAKVLGKAKSIADIKVEWPVPFDDLSGRFAAGFAATRTELTRMIDDLTKWLRTQLRDHDSLTLLGL
jgi:hypothetical protein